MTKPVEIYDYNSKDFGNVLVGGREFQIVEIRQEYDSLNYHYQSPYEYMQGSRYAYIPDRKLMLRLRPVPPPPPPTPKRTWTAAMGLRRPKR